MLTFPKQAKTKKPSIFLPQLNFYFIKRRSRCFDGCSIERNYSAWISAQCNRLQNSIRKESIWLCYRWWAEGIQANGWKETCRRLWDTLLTPWSNYLKYFNSRHHWHWLLRIWSIQFSANVGTSKKSTNVPSKSLWGHDYENRNSSCSSTKSTRTRHEWRYVFVINLSAC